jgi:hypothetical protein
MQPSQIIELIKHDIENGLGVVPLIGSGLSIQSGIPGGIDYHAYLFYCMAKVFGTDGTGQPCGSCIRQWDPATLRWPDFVDVPMYDDLNASMAAWSKGLLEQSPDTKDRYDKVKWLAAGAVADWRAVLNLLSRITLKDDERDGQKRKAVLKHSDPRVIDSFFMTLTRNRKTNSSYQLLAHLADILRIKIILTTNFDNLIESAFQSFLMPVAVFDVHMNAGLPDVDFVRAQRSVIKMHGGRYGLRADYSLDTYPTIDDVEKFTAYLSLYNTDYIKVYDNQRNLLVMGVSGKERRTIGLICRAMLRLPELRVYWICHSEAEIGDVGDSFDVIFTDLERRNVSTRNPTALECRDRLNITASPNASLFLLELYQNIFYSVPPAGVQFPMIWSLPPIAGPREDTVVFRERCDRLFNRIRGMTGKDILAVSEDDAGTSVISEAFNRLSSYCQCIWIDVDEGTTPSGLMLLVLESIARQSGLTGLLPAYVDLAKRAEQEDNDELKAQLSQAVDYSTRRFIIFINDRYTGGIRFDPGKVRQVLQDFNVPMSPGSKYAISYVLVEKSARHAEKLKDEQRSIIKGLLSGEDTESREVVCACLREAYGYKAGSAEDSELKARVADENPFPRFLLSLANTRHVNLVSLLQTWAFIKAPFPLSDERDNDETRYRLARRCLDFLRTRNIVSDDNGNRAFMHPALREEVLALVPDTPTAQLRNLESHQGIADWHMKLFRASGDARAVLESVFHRLACVSEALHPRIGPEIAERFITSSLNEITLDLRLSEATLFSSVQTITVVAQFDRLLEYAQAIFESIQERPGAFGWYAAELERILRDLETKKRRYLDLIGFRGSGGDAKKKAVPAVQVRPSATGCKMDRDKPDDSRQQEQLYREAKRLVKTRQYTEAEARYRELMHMNGFPADEVFPEFANDIKNTGTEGVRKAVRSWISRLKMEADDRQIDSPVLQAALKRMVWILWRYQMLQMYRAQIVRYIKNENPASNAHWEEGSFLKRAEVNYICSTEIMRYVRDLDFITQQNAYLRTNTGILLSRMRRHHEAYRRFNEAYGYLNFGRYQGSPMEFAIVDLRRSESFLCRIDQEHPRFWEPPAHDHTEKFTTDDKKIIGLLFDAIAAVERAEYKLRDNSVSAWWMCWMHELQMGICIYIVRLRALVHVKLKIGEDIKYDLFSRCRDCEMCGTRFIRELNDGNFNAVNDILRTARYYRLAETFEDELRRSAMKESIFGDIRLKRKLEESRALLRKRLTEWIGGHMSLSSDPVFEYIELIHRAGNTGSTDHPAP